VTRVANRKPFKAETPSNKNILKNNSQLRIEQPFDRPFDTLKYIGSLFNNAWHVTPHYHDHFELCLIIEGKGCFFIDDQLYDVKSGDLFLTKPYEVHQGGAAGHEPFKLYFVGFTLSLMSTLEIDYFNIGNQRIIADQDQEIKTIHDCILKEITQKDPHSNMMVQGLFLQMLVSLLRLYSNPFSQNVKQPKTLRPAVKKVLQTLNAHICISHDIEQLAKSVHLSRPHLDREFKRYMGVTIGNYNRTLCLDKAKHLLIESSNSITDIAEHLRFPSLYSFSMFFKRYIGMPPQDYRAQTNDEKC
jgi:AraC-like DNA-binding protein/mannose-6-phosphate isomerase-like protein (cupin superfamily)